MQRENPSYLFESVVDMIQLNGHLRALNEVYNLYYKLYCNLDHVYSLTEQCYQISDH